MIFADEPTGALNRASSNEAMNELLSLNRDGGLYTSNEHYLIIEAGGTLYRVEYIVGNGQHSIAVINCVLGALLVLVIGLLYYIRGHIIVPFGRLNDVPKELARAILLSRYRRKKLLLLSLSRDIKTPLSAIKLGAKGLYKDEEKRRAVAESINTRTDEIERFVSEILSCGPDCLAECLQNLIEDAIKYGDGRRIEISFDKMDGCELIAVSNTGCTLEAKELPQIFESFHRGNNADRVQDNGLGLFICRRLMGLMNGEVYADIRNECFYITLVVKMV